MRYRIFIFTIASALLPMTALAQQAPRSFISLANSLTSLLNAGAVLMITATIVVFFWGIVQRIFKSGQGEVRGVNMGPYIMWGIGIIFLMVSIWGVIALLQYSLFGKPPVGTNAGGSINYR
jgi:hypothetical protein